jgi:hypothetical protein
MPDDKDDTLEVGTMTGEEEVVDDNTNVEEEPKTQE